MDFNQFYLKKKANFSEYCMKYVRLNDIRSKEPLCTNKEKQTSEAKIC